MAKLEVGGTIRGKYRLEEKLGQGGMGEVWRAKHLGFDEDWVVKVLLDPRPEFARSLRAEAKLLRQLQHPNIVSVKDIDTTEDGSPFVAMEWIRGQSLLGRMAPGRTSWQETLRVAGHICAALDYAHSRGVIHRDIKPANILIEGSTGEPMLIDFGIAKVREDSQVSATGMLTAETGMLLCTPQYASPEQAEGRNGDQLDGRTDLYSLGLVMYEMITGVLPFQAPTPVLSLVKRLTEPVIPFSQAVPGLEIPEYVEALVMRALARDRDQRYSSAAEMQAAIRAIETETKTLPPPVDPIPPPVPNRMWVILSAAVAVAVLVFIVFSAYRFDRERAEAARKQERSDRIEAAVRNGVAKMKTRDYGDAVKLFNQAIEIDPVNPRSHLERARSFQALREYPPAKADYTKAIELGHNDSETYSSRAEVNLQLKDHAAATADCNKAITLDPNNKEAYRVRARVRLETGNAADAVADAERSRYADVQVAAWLKVGQHTRAAAACDKILAAESDARSRFLLFGEFPAGTDTALLYRSCAAVKEATGNSSAAAQFHDLATKAESRE